MTRAATTKGSARERESPPMRGPLVWSFDGAFATCLADLEDTFRRALAQAGDVARIVVMIELCLPALEARLQRGEAIQPAWSRFLEAITARYGLPAAPRIRYLKTPAPLATLVIAYRS